MAALANVQFEDELIRYHDRRLWYGFIGVLIVAALLAAANLVQTFKPHAVPYVVVLNEKGEPTAVAHAVQSTAALNDATIKWAIMQFVRNAMTVTNNLGEQKEMINTALAFVRQQGDTALRAYYFDNNGEHLPWNLYLKKWVSVQITRQPWRLPAPDTWEVDASVTTHDYQSGATETTNWRTTVKATVTTPDSKDFRNPIGVYFTSLSFDQEVQ
jgi:type IV secretory pathway TrbF-like protein